MQDFRIKEHPVHELERGKKVSFIYDGRTIDAYENETIVAALLASGIKILSRSSKYHRPRSIYATRGKCGRCLMEIDGIPNLNACTTIVREGMVVKSQNAYPSVRRDIYLFIDYFDFIFHGGFQYHWFKRPKFLIPSYQKIIRSLSGLGKLPSNDTRPNEIYDIETIEPEIVIIGGGPAGISAAHCAAQKGAGVILIDENTVLGGHINSRTDFLPGLLEEYKGLRGFELSRRLCDDLKELNNIKILTNAKVFGYYREGVIGVIHANKPLKLRPKRIIVATGAYERPLIFENNDLPGIYSGRTVLHLLNTYGIKPGHKALVIGGNDVSLATAYQLVEAGVELVGVIDTCKSFNDSNGYAEKLRARGVKLLPSHTIDKAHGKRRVKAATIIEFDGLGKVIENSKKKFRCDVICLACNLQPTYELCFQANCKMEYQSGLGGFTPIHNEYMETSVEGFYVAGDAAGIKPVEMGIVEGRIAGISVASSLKHVSKESDQLEEGLIRIIDEFKSEKSKRKNIHGEILRGNRKNFVCTCEDITVKDVLRASREWSSDIEVLKRYLGSGTGPCQGKYCLTNLSKILALEKGQSPSEMRMTTQRPPIEPILLGILAGGAHNER